MRSLASLGMTKKNLLVFLVVAFLFISVSPVLAAPGAAETPKPPEGDVLTKSFLDSAGFTYLDPTKQDVRLYVVALIKIALSFTGFLFFLLIFYGGYLWMAAGGNEEILKKAKSIITKAVVGFAIVLAAYSITYFLGQYIGQAIAPSEGNVPGPKQDAVWDYESMKLDDKPGT